MTDLNLTNTKLIRQRIARRWSQAKAAEMVQAKAASLGRAVPSISPMYFYRWERRGVIPHNSHAELVCLTFDVPPADLGWPPDLVPWPPRPTASSPDADASLSPASSASPALSASVAGVVLLGTSDPADRLNYVLRHPTRVDTETLEHLEHVLVVLETVERDVEAGALVGAALGHLGSLTTLLRASLPPSARAYLCSIAGETAGLVARLYNQLSQAADAASYFHAALNAAHEASDGALSAYLIGVMAGQPQFRDQPARRLNLLASAAITDASPPTRVFLAAKQADAHALLGQTDSTLRALSQAEVSMASLPQPTMAPRPRAPWWPHDIWLAGEQGATLARLGDHRLAEHHICQVLAGPVNPKHRLWLLAAMARVRAGQNETDEAARLAHQIVSTAIPLQLTTVLHEIALLRRELQSGDSLPAIRQLDDALASNGVLV